MTELTIWEQISAPLDPSEIKVRDAGGTAVPYIDRTSVEMRLNSVCPDDWHFLVTPITVPNDGSKGAWVVKGSLTIHGVTREDFGMNDNMNNFDPPKAAVSDALKRCAALFGFGRELAEDPRGSVAKANGTQAGRKSTPPAPPKAPQTPPEPASATPAPQGTQEATPAAEWPADNAVISQLDGKALYTIQTHGPALFGIDGQGKHFTKRFRERFGVKDLRDINQTWGDFKAVMILTHEEWEAQQAGRAA